MITYEWNHNDLEYVKRKLGSMKEYAPRALRDAVNKTAQHANSKLRKVAQERYTVKASGFNSRADIKKATLASQVALLRYKGSTLTLQRFHYTAPKSGVQVEVLKGEGLKTLVGDRGIKAFVSHTASGNKRNGAKGTKVTKQILQREKATRYPLKVLHSVSVPKQIEMVYDGKRITSTPLKEEIEKYYRHSIEQQIQRFLNR